MSKRQRFIITSIILSLGFVGIQLLSEQYRFLSIGSLGLLTIILFYWSLREGLNFDLTLLTLVLPFAFTIGVGLFWFLLPSSIYTRIPIVVLFGMGMYALCLTSNIYTVAAIRTIALARAARGVGFVLTLTTFFLIFDAILSIHLPIYLASIFISLTSIPLFMQSYWTINLSKHFHRELMLTSTISSLIIGQISFGLYFWPVTVVVSSLFLTVYAYIMLGLGQSKLEGRLFAQTIREHLVLGIFVFFGMFMATRWG